VVDAPTGHVTLGAFMANGIEQKGIDNLQQCIKKCASAGLGIPANVCILNLPWYPFCRTFSNYSYEPTVTLVAPRGFHSVDS